MPLHVPRSSAVRKQEVLEKREAQLFRVLREAKSKSRVQEAAENVRVAQLNVIKAKLHWESTFQAEDENHKTSQNRRRLEKERGRWKSIEVEEIIQAYRKRLRINETGVRPP